MDRERITEIALQKYKDSDFRTPNAFCFAEGAEWMMQQPLKERLTKKDKKEIADWINDIAFFMPDKRSVTMLQIGAKSLFGKDLFNDESRVL